MHDPPVPRYRIERATDGYRVVGPGLWCWEPTLEEAVEQRRDLETAGGAYPGQEAVPGSPALPFESVIYGPIRSRRFGRSLGVNLTPPRYCVCSFSCVYCPYPVAPRPRARARWATPERVAVDLCRALESSEEIDSVTVSGHGEPTLHPRFVEVAERLLEVARRTRPAVPVRILTNGSTSLRAEIRKALAAFDDRIVKLDAETPRVCRPAPPWAPGAWIAGISMIPDLTIQSCFIEGAYANTHPRAVRAWAELLGGVRPRAAQIYTIDQPASMENVRPVTADQLEEIACRLRAWTGIEATVFA